MLAQLPIPGGGIPTVPGIYRMRDERSNLHSVYPSILPTETSTAPLKASASRFAPTGHSFTFSGWKPAKIAKRPDLEKLKAFHATRAKKNYRLKRDTQFEGHLIPQDRLDDLFVLAYTRTDVPTPGLPARSR